MYWELTITKEHPDNEPKEKLVLELTGGSPWYGYLWLDGECYVVTKGARTYKFRKVK